MTDNFLDVSVVIGFKDWGLERLELSLKTIQKSISGSLNGEIIVSDYGSIDGESVRRVVEDSGARWIRSETDGEWSRSRALNAGIRSSSGRWVFTTDADMLFTPETYPSLVEWLENHRNHAVVLQCRDLPAGHSHETVKSRGLLWGEFEQRSKLRPRWGMGGLFGLSRRMIDDVGGYDERMHTYGGEDLDFALRVRRSGTPVTWIEDPRVRMYHVWHPSTHAAINKETGGKEAVRENQAILKEDRSWVRNPVRGSTRPHNDPLVSFLTVVEFPAKNLGDTIFSALGQTIGDVECIIVRPEHIQLDIEFRNNYRIVDVVVSSNTSFEEMNAEALRRARGRWVTFQPPGTTSMSDRAEALLKLIRGGEAGAWSGIAMIDPNARVGQRVMPQPPLEGSSRAWVDGTGGASLFLRTDLLHRALEPLGGKTSPGRLGAVVASAGLTLSCAQRALVGVWSYEVDESVEARLESQAANAALKSSWAGMTSGHDEKFGLGTREILELSPSTEVRRSGVVELPPGVDPKEWMSGLSGKVRLWSEQNWDDGQRQTTLRFDDLSRNDLAQLKESVPDFEPLIEWTRNERGDSISRQDPVTEVIGKIVSEAFNSPAVKQVAIAVSKKREELNDISIALGSGASRGLTVITEEIKLNVLLLPIHTAASLENTWQELVRRRDSPGSSVFLVQSFSKSILPGQIDNETAVFDTRSKAVNK